VSIRIERLTPPFSDENIRALSHLLVDTVESGAAVSFMLPLSHADADAWWRETTASASPRAVFLVARDAQGIVGTVQLHPAWAPNQPHRAEISKLMVHRRAQRHGLGEALMRAIEEAARDAGFRLLTLDAKRGVAAERLYRRMGWIAIGTFPRYALDPDRAAMHDAVVFYKEFEP
jgi:GNAT superfamily N-acetyltransferase